MAPVHPPHGDPASSAGDGTSRQGGPQGLPATGTDPRAQTARRVPAWLSTALVVALGLTVPAVGAARTEVLDTALARDLQEHGVRATATQVEVYAASTCRYCFADDEVRARVGGARVTLRGVAVPSDGVPAETWTRPPEGSVYAEPLAVRYDPQDRTRVMAQVDVDDYLDGGYARTWLLVAAVCAAVTAVLLGLVVRRAGLPWLRARRLRRPRPAP